ncbi:MAG: DivIVA family protein [Frankiales bacterium]|nr:DivIVA family protein [Frankiales bacterium]
MPLTPQDVVNKKFATKLRGYDQDEVDVFLDEVEQELVRLLTENATLQQRLSVAAPTAAAAAPAAPTEAPPTGAPIAPGEPQEAALRTLLMAQRTADQAIAEARAEADALLAQAKSRQAQIDTEINARTAKAMAELEARRAELETRIEDLRAFEREYRLRLKAYLEGQLKDLEGRSVNEGPGTGVPAAARSAAIGTPPAGAAAPAANRPPAPPAPPAPSAPAAPPGPPGPSAAAFPVTAPSAGPAVALPAEWAELHEGAETRAEPQAEPSGGTAAPAGPPREAHGLRAVPPLSTGAEPVGPFTVVPPPVTVEQVEDGPEPPAET